MRMRGAAITTSVRKGFSYHLHIRTWHTVPRFLHPGRPCGSWRTKDYIKSMKRTCVFFTGITFLLNQSIIAQKVDYSVVSVPDETGIEFVPITSDNDCVCMPIVKRKSDKIDWLSNRTIDISPTGEQIAFLAQRNNTINIFIKDLDKQSNSIQRTNRLAVLDFSYSTDGKLICFSEQKDNTNQIFQTDANKGYSCKQITYGFNDYSPIYSADMQSIFFARQETNAINIWSYNIQNNNLSHYTTGMNPYPTCDNTTFLCSRPNAEGYYEIWKINYTTGKEDCIASHPQKSFTTPSLSPNGEWIVFVGNNRITHNKGKKGNDEIYILPSRHIDYQNTDIFVCRLDGSQFTQLTHHAADDLSPVWSKDGKYIYFISQRGSATGTANVWRMNFNH